MIHRCTCSNIAPCALNKNYNNIEYYNTSSNTNWITTNNNPNNNNYYYYSIIIVSDEYALKSLPTNMLLVRDITVTFPKKEKF